MAPVALLRPSFAARIEREIAASPGS